MTRSWTFILPDTNWHNIWSLMNADPSNQPSNQPTDATFAYVPFLPKSVNSFKYQSQNALTNANNGGAVISLAFDSKLESGVDILSGSWDSINSSLNDIVLDQISVKSTIAGAGINISISVN